MDDSHEVEEPVWTHPQLRPTPEQVRYQTEHEWRVEVLFTLKGIQGLLMQLVEGSEFSVKQEPAAASIEPPGNEELPTWILTDEAVSRIEDAIEAEQRVRGRAYGG